MSSAALGALAARRGQSQATGLVVGKLGCIEGAPLFRGDVLVTALVRGLNRPPKWILDVRFANRRGVASACTVNKGIKIRGAALVERDVVDRSGHRSTAGAGRGRRSALDSGFSVGNSAVTL